VEYNDFLQKKLNWSRRKITTKWPYKDGTISAYKYSSGLITGNITKESLNIAVGKEWGRTTMLHEYGHAVMSALYGYNDNNLPKGNYKEETHTVNTVSDTAFAIIEGWAEFSGALIDDNAYNLPQYANANTPNIEYNSWWKGKEQSNTQGELVEGTVASILWDIVDTDQSKDEVPNKDDDNISGMLNELWDTMSKKKPKSIIDFWNYWQDNNYGQLESLRNIFINNAVNVTIKPQNNPPTANPQNIITNEDVAIDIVLTGNDADSDPLTFRIIKAPSNGTLSGQLPNQKYIPKSNFFGSDSFDFVVNDGKVDSQPAAITITINKINDPPTVTSVSIATDEDTPVKITLIGTDIDNDPLTFRILSQPTNGTLGGVSPNFTYTPKLNFNGNDSFTFVANDGVIDSNVETANIVVKPVNDAPIPEPQSVIIDEDSLINITLTATDPDGDKLTYKTINRPSNGTLSGTPPAVTYKPNLNFNGEDSFTFTVGDGKLESQPAKVSITVNPINDAPISVAQSVTTDEDTAIKIVLTGTDVDGDKLTYKIVDQPLNGTIGGTPPEMTYKPKQDFNGNDSFAFTVNDGKLESQPTKVSITVKSVNDPPVAIAQSIAIDENVSAKIVLSASDLDGDTITFKIIAQPTNGSISGNPPELIYKPNYGFGGEDSFTFVANDGKSDSAPTTIKITVNLIPNPIDINKDGIVNILDLVIIGKYYGKEVFPLDYSPDVNRDHKVDNNDFEVVQKNFGKKM
ncbi:MAG: Ig-like domain-containing protein, partial [Candidatus Poribacteria bacterium]